MQINKRKVHGNKWIFNIDLNWDGVVADFMYLYLYSNYWQMFAHFVHFNLLIM